MNRKKVKIIKFPEGIEVRNFSGTTQIMRVEKAKEPRFTELLNPFAFKILMIKKECVCVMDLDKLENLSEKHGWKFNGQI